MVVITSTSVFICCFGAAPMVPISPYTRPMRQIAMGAPLVMSDILFTPAGICMNPANPLFKPPFVPTPPCVPLIGPWVNTSTKVMMSGIPAVKAGSMANCLYAPGGIITPIPTNPKVIISL